jgi:hypothetical protein
MVEMVAGWCKKGVMVATFNAGVDRKVAVGVGISVGRSVREGALGACGSVRVHRDSAGSCGAYSGACGEWSGLIIRRSQVRILEGPFPKTSVLP